MRSSSEQYLNNSGLIDKKIGELYSTLELVTENLTELKHVSFYMPQLFEIHTNIDDLLKLTTADLALNFTTENIGALADYFDALSTLITDRDSLDALANEIEGNATLASEWAEKAEDVEVVSGKFSALHHAAKALGYRNEAETIVDDAANAVTTASAAAINVIEELRDNSLVSMATLRDETVESASAAALSATNAANSETAAGTQATNAGLSADNASSAATDAENSAIIASAAETIVSAALTHYIIDNDFVNFVNKNIGAMNTEQASLIQNTIYRLKNKNIWDKLDFLNIDFGIGQQALLTNMIDPSITQTVYNLVYTSGDGFLGNGTDGYVDVGIQVDSANNYSLNSAHVGIYSLTSVGVDGRDFGVDSGTDLYFEAHKADGTAIGRINKDSNSSSAILPNGLGLFGIDRSSNNSVDIYHNGVSLDNDTDTADSLPSGVNFNIFKGASSYSNKQISCWHGGSSLTSQEWLDLYDIIVDTRA